MKKINGKELLTYKEAQEKCLCGRSKLQAAVVSGLIEAYRPGKEVLLESCSLERWFCSTKIVPVKRVGSPRKGAVRV